MKSLEPLKWQSLVLQLRNAADLWILAGGRGGGKTHCSMLMLTAHTTELMQHAAPVIIRDSHAGLLETLGAAYEFATAAYGTKGVSMNKSDAAITLPTGGKIYGASLHEGIVAANRWQGRNLTGIFAEEVGGMNPIHYAAMRRFESNLRPPKGKRAMRVWTANPGGLGHHNLLRNYLSKVPPFRLGNDAQGLNFLWCSSTYRENTSIDQDAYARNLRASTGNDEALSEAWLNGDWQDVSGILFPMNPLIHFIPDIPAQVLRNRCRFTVGSDWGLSAPSTAVLIAELKEPLHHADTYYPPGTTFVCDEVHTLVNENDLTQGTGLDPRSFAEVIYTMLLPYGAQRCQVVVDQYRGLQGDLVTDYFKEAGLKAKTPNKGSRSKAWDAVRQMLADAETNHGPGLYFTERAKLSFQSFLEAPRYTLNPREIDPKYPKHFCDAVSYGLKEANRPKAGNGVTIGMW